MKKIRKSVIGSGPSNGSRHLRPQAEQCLQIVGAPGRLQAFDVEAGLGGFILLDQIQGDAPQDGEVLGAVRGR